MTSRTTMWTGNCLRAFALLGLLTFASAAAAQELVVGRVSADLARPDPAAAYWKDVPAADVMLMAQPMVAPRPEKVAVDALRVQALHNGKQLAFRLTWKDPAPSEGGLIGDYSDGAALQFPVKEAPFPPLIMMGDKDNPVHILHWRAQYQRDRKKGKPTMRELYPNKSIDIYPFEFADHGSLPPFTDAERAVFSPARAEGNPQSFPKTGVDELLAYGFGSSAVIQGTSVGEAEWKDGQWTLVVSRPLAIAGASSFAVGGKGHVGFALWEGGQGEVGSRKSVTMAWLPLQLAAK